MHKPSISLLVTAQLPPRVRLTQSLQCQDPVTVHVWSCLELRYGSSAQDNSDFQPQLYGRRIAKVGCNATLGRIEVVNKIVSELVKLREADSPKGIYAIVAHWLSRAEQ